MELIFQADREAMQRSHGCLVLSIVSIQFLCPLYSLIEEDFMETIVLQVISTLISIQERDLWGGTYYVSGNTCRLAKRLGYLDSSPCPLTDFLDNLDAVFGNNGLFMII